MDAPRELAIIQEKISGTFIGYVAIMPRLIQNTIVLPIFITEYGRPELIGWGYINWIFRIKIKIKIHLREVQVVYERKKALKFQRLFSLFLVTDIDKKAQGYILLLDQFMGRPLKSRDLTPEEWFSVVSAGF